MQGKMRKKCVGDIHSCSILLDEGDTKGFWNVQSNS
jgi:hypothetical protein